MMFFIFLPCIWSAPSFRGAVELGALSLTGVGIPLAIADYAFHAVAYSDQCHTMDNQKDKCLNDFHCKWSGSWLSSDKGKCKSVKTFAGTWKRAAAICHRQTDQQSCIDIQDFCYFNADGKCRLNYGKYLITNTPKPLPRKPQTIDEDEMIE